MPPGYVIAKIADSSTVAVPLKPACVTMPETTTGGYNRFVGMDDLQRGSSITVMSTPAPVTYTADPQHASGGTYMPAMTSLDNSQGKWFAQGGGVPPG